VPDDDRMAARMAASQIDRAAARLARDAQHLADDAERFAQDTANGVPSSGLASRLAQDALQLALSAARLDAMREIASLLPQPSATGEDTPT
jgi:hypothetical protein